MKLKDVNETSLAYSREVGLDPIDGFFFFFTEGLSSHLKLFFLFFLFVVDFVIHLNETAMGLHVFPIPLPPPTSLIP